MKWSSLHLPSAFLSLTPSNHRPGITRMTADSHGGGDDDGAPSSSTAVTRPPRESTTMTAAPAASAGKKRRGLFSFADARRMARGHGFDSREEFDEYSCPGAYQIPKDADVVWKEVRRDRVRRRSLAGKKINAPTHPPEGGGREGVSLSPPPLLALSMDVPLPSEMRYGIGDLLFENTHTRTHTHTHTRARVRIYSSPRRASRHITLPPSFPSLSSTRVASGVDDSRTHTQTGEKRNGGDGMTSSAYRYRSRKVGRSRDRWTGSTTRVPTSISSGVVVGRYYPTTTSRAGCRTGRM